MTKSKLLILAAAPALVLCSCAKKCSYEDFVKAVGEIEKAPKITEVTVKGTIKYGDEKIEVKKTTIKVDNVGDASEDALELASMMIMNHVSLYTVSENKDATYYAGSSFKVKTDEVTIEWDKYGNCTSIDGEEDGEEVDISCKYTYED